ncbi:MAG: hypothetical protein V4481_02560 [Patescibacteria group bacterium]
MYLSWNEQTVIDFSDTNITSLYDKGYVFTRKGLGIMNQTRSVRIDLSKFNLSSENKRILKKTVDIIFESTTLPYSEYTFVIGKLAKDFYATKFGPGTMSAQKIKEIFTDQSQSNFNLLLKYTVSKSEDRGFAVCYKNSQIMHYSYPFYDLEKSPKEMGMGMMVRAVQYAKDAGLQYIYLGSLQRPSDTYKFQFEGMEWFDGKEWSADMEKVKEILKSPL